MYERLRAMYFDGRLTDEGLDLAVGKGWITQAQADQIRAEYAAANGEDEGAVMDALILDALTA